MAEFLTEFITDLASPPQLRTAPHQFAMGDNNAYTFTALVANTAEPEAALLAGTVSGTALRPDGTTVALEGVKGTAVRQVTLSGQTLNATPCSVTLPQACFAYPGRVLISIKLTDGTTATTVLAIAGTVIRTETDAAVDPGEIIPDLAELQAVAAEAMTAAAGSVRFDQAQTLTDAQKQQARTNIGAGTGGGGGGGGEGAVRYDEAQTLSDAQKIMARGNISAASIIPTGTAFAQAVQDGTTYDVQDTAARAEADIANLSGIDLAGFGGLSASKTLVGYTYNRTANRVTISGTGTTTTNVQVCITGASGITSQNNDETHPDKLVNANAVLLAGHVYSISARYVSGTVTKTGSNAFNICWYTKYGTAEVARSNLTTDMYSDFSGGKAEWRTNISPNANAALGIGFYQRTGYTFSDFVLEFNIEDITDKLRTVTLGTAETRVASRDYAKDELVLYLGRLYTARNAITAGTALSTGTSSGNITSVSLLDYIADPSITVTSASPTITALTGRRYICSASYVTSLSFTPSATGICSVRFVSGTTPTVLTLPNTVVMPEWWTGVEASRTYEISIEDGIYGAVTSWA